METNPGLIFRRLLASGLVFSSLGISGFIGAVTTMAEDRVPSRVDFECHQTGSASVSDSSAAVRAPAIQQCPRQRMRKNIGVRLAKDSLDRSLEHQ